MDPLDSLLTRPQPLLAVIFDMDGVLCDSEEMMCRAAVAMFQQEHGTVVEPDDFLPFLGAGEDRYLGGVAEKHGVRLDMPADKERAYALYLEGIRGRLQPLPGAVEFVQACRQLSLKTAVATGADRVKMDGSLREIGLPPAEFDALVTGDDISQPKPAPDIFRVAAGRLEVDPAQCLVVEDSTNGVAAARAAGCCTLAVAHTFSPAELRAAGADEVIPSFMDEPAGAVLNALAKWSG